MTNAERYAANREARAARREARRAAVARIGDEARLGKGKGCKGVRAQMDHASSAKARRKARQGQRAMQNDRPDLDES